MGQEDGSAFRTLCVPDLITSASTAIEILIILESPQADELDQGHPVSGQAGTDPLRFLRSPLHGEPDMHARLEIENAYYADLESTRSATPGPANR